MSAPAGPDRLTLEELRDLFLFADLNPDQLEWVSRAGDVVDVLAGADVSVEGEPAECFYVLLSGTLSMVRRVGGDEVETVRTDARGGYSGAAKFYLETRSRTCTPRRCRR